MIYPKIIAYQKLALSAQIRSQLYYTAYKQTHFVPYPLLPVLIDVLF